MEREVAAPGRTATVAVEVVSDPTVMSGEPVVRGTRIQAANAGKYDIGHINNPKWL